MKGFSAISATVLASVAYAQQSGPACNAISYDMSGHPGSITYSSVMKYSWDMGGCSMQPQSYSSPISPLDQGLTAVFRGPLHLKQFAVYNEHTPSKKRSAKASPRERRHHNHARFHKKHAEPEADVEADVEKRDCGKPVVATYNGVPFTMTDTWSCGSTPAAAAPAAAAPAANLPVAAVEAVAVKPSSSAPAAAATTPASSGSSSSSSGSSSSSSSGSGAWKQVSYYSASSPSKSSNVTFLYPVPYANTDYLPASGDMKSGPASSPQMLNDVLIGDNERFYVASGTKMTDSVAPSNKAYHGFAGNKIMLVEMSMPMSGLRDGSAYPDMPAFWLLNEQLPATSDGSQCSCWATGCGEMDVHEVLTAGATIGYSTLHMGQNYCGGASNGFKRATSGTQKLAVIIKAGSTSTDSVVRIVQLDDSYDFGSSISESDYQSWLTMPVAGGQKGSVAAPSAGNKCA